MSEELFRREVLDARCTSWLGAISLAQPLALWILAVAGILCAVAVAAFGIWGEYTRRSVVTGQLVPDLGLSTVMAPTSGIIARIFPEEGQQVQVEEALALVQVPRAMASGRDALAVLRKGLHERRESLEQLARSQLAQLAAQEAGLARQLSGARQELAQIEREIASRREQVQLGNETAERYRRVAGQKYVSQVQLNQQQQAVLELINAQQALERQAISLRRNVDQLEQALRELPAQRGVLQATARRDLATLEQERVQQEASSELLIKAPVAGLVASRLLEPGQSVQAGQPLMNLLPRGSKLQAKLWVPSRAIGFIEPGDRVLLRYQAYPFQKFGHHAGRILRISRSAVSGSTVDGQANEHYYRVLVTLDQQDILAYGKPEPLRPGMTLEADILGERRKLYEWVLEPLYSLRGKTGN